MIRQRNEAATATPADHQDLEALLAAESQRCDAISRGDREALGAVVSDDLTYRHSTGVVEGKADYLETSIGGARRSASRPSGLDVRIIGDAAVVIGDYRIELEPSQAHPNGYRLDAAGLQVWRREDGQWRLLAHHGSDIGADPEPRVPSE